MKGDKQIILSLDKLRRKVDATPCSKLNLIHSQSNQLESQTLKKIIQRKDNYANAVSSHVKIQTLQLALGLPVCLCKIQILNFMVFTMLETW